jgi:outer membrane murein-binding lipoprotein Lpp
MRGKWRFVASAIAGALLVVPTEAAANGGSYLEFDQTYYVPGDHGVAVAYVSVPKKHEDLLERGPFHLFAVPEGLTIREGRPIPSGTVRLGTFAVEEEGTSYELQASFTAPYLAAGDYEMALCNDPCTIAGFGEPLSGSISIVATQREADLLTRNDRLRSTLHGARREARRAERRLAAVAEELETQLAFGSSERAEMTAEIDRLETQLAAARARVNAPTGRTPFDPWVVGAILLLTSVAAMLAFRRRRIVAALAPGTGAEAEEPATPLYFQSS